MFWAARWNTKSWRSFAFPMTQGSSRTAIVGIVVFVICATVPGVQPHSQELRDTEVCLYWVRMDFIDREVYRKREPGGRAAFEAFVEQGNLGTFYIPGLDGDLPVDIKLETADFTSFVNIGPCRNHRDLQSRSPLFQVLLSEPLLHRAVNHSYYASDSLDMLKLVESNQAKIKAIDKIIDATVIYRARYLPPKNPLVAIPSPEAPVIEEDTGLGSKPDSAPGISAEPPETDAPEPSAPEPEQVNFLVDGPDAPAGTCNYAVALDLNDGRGKSEAVEVLQAFTDRSFVDRIGLADPRGDGTLMRADWGSTGPLEKSVDGHACDLEAQSADPNWALEWASFNGAVTTFRAVAVIPGQVATEEVSSESGQDAAATSAETEPPEPPEPPVFRVDASALSNQCLARLSNRLDVEQNSYAQALSDWQLILNDAEAEQSFPALWAQLALTDEEKLVQLNEHLTSAHGLSAETSRAGNVVSLVLTPISHRFRLKLVEDETASLEEQDRLVDAFTSSDFRLDPRVRPDGRAVGGGRLALGVTFKACRNELATIIAPVMAGQNDGDITFVSQGSGTSWQARPQ